MFRMYDKKIISVTSHALYPPSPCHKLSHLLGPPPPSSVTYFMDGPQVYVASARTMTYILLKQLELSQQRICSDYYYRYEACTNSELLFRNMS